jgi:hypothetical protein
VQSAVRRITPALHPCHEYGAVDSWLPRNARGGRSVDRSEDTSTDASEDASGEGQWLTYAELAKRRGIDRASAVRLAIRRHWRRQKGNTGREVRVLVPPEALTTDASEDRSEHTSLDLSGDISGVVSAFEVALGALREQLERSEQGRESAIALVDQTLAALADSNARTDRAEAETRALRDRIEALQTQLSQAQAAVEGADALRQADDARKAMSRWGRAWRAWRGR